MLNDCAHIELSQGSIESVAGSADVIISNPPFMCERTALSLSGGGRYGLETPVHFVRHATKHNRHIMIILETPSGTRDRFLEEVQIAPAVKRVLRKRPGFELTVYEFGAA